MREIPWWATLKYLIHHYKQESHCSIAVYSNLEEKHHEYAIVEWRSGSAYLMGLYLNGKNITPVDPRVVEARDFRAST